MGKLMALLLVGLLFEAVGVVLLSRGLKQLDGVETVSVPRIARVIKQGATNVNILAGVFCEAVFFGTLLILMSRGDVSLIWPLTALGFVLTTIAAKFILHETVSASRWAGVLLIMLGAALISWSEQHKPAPADAHSPGPDAAVPRAAPQS
jgi:drug/metabolite transporter (DMT)-like permease